MKKNNELCNFDGYVPHEFIKDHFPYEKPRDLQLETISKIYDAIEDGYKYIFLEAASGFGKSAIAITLSDIYSSGKTYILTTTHQLASQYLEEFEEYGLKKVEPRSNFPCLTKRNGSYCAIGSCKWSKCKYHPESRRYNGRYTCNFISQLEDGLNSSTVITTYSYFLSENFYSNGEFDEKYSNDFPKRNLVICDEGHNIDDKIAERVKLTVSFNDLKDLGINIKKELRELEYSDDYDFLLQKIRTKYRKELERKKPGSPSYVKTFMKLNKINKFLEHIGINKNNIAYSEDETAINFYPVITSNFAEESLFNAGNVFLFMSSSFFDYSSFANDLGIEKDEIYILRVPNIFDLSKNPVKIYKKYNMDYKNLSEYAEPSLEIIKEILDKHPNEKGIIHTVSTECMEYINKNLNNSRLICHTTANRKEILDQFKNSNEPKVLVSPSMNEGVDLPGDLCRFQIIYKLPYYALSERVKLRSKTYKSGEDWYDYKMLTKLIQTYGRGIRFEGDYCKTYILDNRILGIIEKDLQGDELIPKYFIESMEVEKDK